MGNERETCPLGLPIKSFVRSFTFEGVTTDYLFDAKGMVGRGLHTDWTLSSDKMTDEFIASLGEVTAG